MLYVALFLLVSFGLGNICSFLYNLCIHSNILTTCEWARFAIQEATVSYLSFYLAIKVFKGICLVSGENKRIALIWFIIGLSMTWLLYQSDSAWILLLLAGVVKSYSAANEAHFEVNPLSISDAVMLVVPKWARSRLKQLFKIVLINVK